MLRHDRIRDEDIQDRCGGCNDRAKIGGIFHGKDMYFALTENRLLTLVSTSYSVGNNQKADGSNEDFIR